MIFREPVRNKLNIKNTGLLLLLNLISFSTFQPLAANEYSIRKLFCITYAINQSNLYSNKLTYKMKRKYNYCIRNYNKLFNVTEEKIKVKLEKIKRKTEKRIKEKEGENPEILN